MGKITVYNQQGKKVKEIALNPKIFDIEIKPMVVQQVVVAQTANSRDAIAHTKSRPEVRGGGRKPWRQKGTGRARHGSNRSPLWVGGGITFGPTKERNFSKKVNKKVKIKALFMALSDKARGKKIVVVDKLELSEAKTKALVEAVAKLPNRDQKTLIAMSKKDTKIVMAAKNVPTLKTIAANSLNIVDLLNYQFLLITEKGLKTVEETYLKD